MNPVSALGRVSACGARLAARLASAAPRERLDARSARALAASCALLLALPGAASTLDPSGDLDTGFDVDGKAQFNFGTSLVPADSRALIVQPGGKIVVAGGSNNGLYKDYVVTRLNTDGTTDSSFGIASFGVAGVTNTDMGFDDHINALAQNSTGMRFCGGGISGALFGVACYTANGVLDTTFSSDGIVLDNAPASVNGGSNVGRIEGMTFDRNDKPIAVGWGDFPTGRDWVIRRWNTDGTPDTAFGNQGWVVIDHGGSDRAFDATIIPVAGGTNHSNDIIVVTGTRSTPSPRGVITLLKMDGSLYTTSNSITGTSGKGYYEPGGTTQFRGVAIQSDNDHVVVTGQGAGFLVSRFSLSNSTVQTSANLGTDGNDVGFRVRIATVAGNERVYASGTHNSGVDFDIARLPVNLGAAEYNAVTSLSSGSDFAQDLAVDTSNGFVTAAGTASGSLTTIAVVRYNASGALDTNFATGGIYHAAIMGGSSDTSNAFAVQSDGKAIVAGTTFNSSGDYDLLVTRVNTDGTRDTAGWASATSGWDTRGFAAGSAEQVNPGGVAIDSNGKAVVVGTYSGGYFAVRYNTNGTLDSGFDTDGIVLNNWGTNSEGKVVAIDASNNVIVGGDISLNGDFKFSRLAASNGAIDNAFGTSGTATVDISAGKSDVLKAIAIDPSGRIVAGGACVAASGSFKMCMARLNANGSLDATFNGTGKVFLSGLSGNDTFDIRSLQLLPDLDTASATDYKIVVGGQYVQSSPSQAMWLVARFNMDGSLDTTFNTTGWKGFPAGPSTNIGSANSVALQYDEKIIVFGETSVVDTQNPGFYLARQVAVARLNWDGSLDTTYGDNGFRYATQGSDPGEAYQGYVYPQSSALKGRALATNFIIASDFALTRYREDPSPISGASAPDLDVNSDTGRSSTDNITKDTTPTFTGTCSQGETVYLLVNGSNTQPRTRQICGAAGTYALTPSLSGVPRTTYAISTQTQSGIGDSAASAALSVTVDAEINPAVVISSPAAGSNVLPHPTVSGTSEGAADVVVTTTGIGSGCASPNLADASGNWTCNSTFEQGAHTISVVQTDIAGNVSGATTRSFNVKLPTSTAITVDVNPSRYGQTVTYTATVTSTGGYTIESPLTGTSIRFQVDGADAATRTLDATGTATFAIATLGVGTHTVSAIYDENANWLGSSAALSPSQTVLKADTTTAVVSSVNPSVFGQGVTFTATVAAVSPGGGTPAGTVNFTIDGGAPNATTLNASGQATFSTAALGVGSHSVAVDYQGNGNYNPSSTTLSGGQTVNKASTSVAVSASPNPSTRGQNVTFTATVSAVAPGAGVPAGTVTFTIDGTAAGTQPLSAGVATFATATLASGSHTVSASYSGDGNFLGNTGTLTGGQQVDKGTSNTAIVSSLNPSQYGQSVTLTATVTASAPTTDTPTGSVDFVIDGGAPQTMPLDGTAKATLVTSTLTGGTHTVVANYSGDTNLKTSSATLSPAQTVQPLSTTTTVTSSVNPSVFGEGVTFTAVVAVTGPGSGTPAGNVNFSIDGGAAQPQPLDATGHAALGTSSLTVGTHTVAASYAGDGNYSSSSGSLSPTQTVNKSGTQTNVTSSLNPAPQAQSVTFTVTVAGTPPSTGTPTGTVDLFVDGGVTPFATQTLSAGSAAFSTAALVPGSHTVSATYRGDDPNFTGSSATLVPDQVVFTQDFGDAPAPYPTLLADDGARHRIGGPHLGATVDAELDGQPSANADGDDNNGSPSDEDGVTFTSALIPGRNATVTVIASADAMLDAWIDFNANGGWADAGEQIFVSTPVTAGSNLLTFAVPANTPPQTAVYARFRISSAGGLGVTGFAADGEVEDYKVITSPVIDLSVDESEAADPVVAGSGVGNLVHTVTVTNNGPSAASGVALNEVLVLPAGVSLASSVASQGTFAGSAWNVGSLAAGAKATLTLAMTAAANAAPGVNVVCGTASVSAANEPLFNTADDTDSECTSIVRQVDLAVAQTESVDPVVAGSGSGNLSYALTVQNNGPSNASNVVLTEALTLPTGVTLVSATPSQGSFSGSTWNLGALGAGAGATLNVVLTAASSAAAGTDTICAAASVAGAAETLINAGNDSASTCTSVTRQVDLHVTATDTPDPVSAGSGTGNLTHTITVSNAGVSDASGVTLSDVFTLPPGTTIVSSTPSVGSFSGTTWTLGGLAKGSNATLTVLLTVGASTADAASVCGTASVTAANETLINTADDSATECTTVAHTADLAITKTANANPPQAGANLIYTIAVHNAGPGDASGVKVTDNLPAAVTLVQTTGCQEDANVGGGIPTCTLGTLASGSDKSFTVEVAINPQPPSSISNTASVTANETDPNPANNQSTATTTLDNVAPTVVAIETVGHTADIAVNDCATLRGSIGGITIRFSEAMADPAGDASAGDVTNPASYRLVRAQPNAAFATASCSDPPNADIAEAFAVSYDAASHTATLSTAKQADGIHRLLVCRTVHDIAGNPLANSSAPNTDVSVTYRVDSNNWLASGHFDRYPGCSGSPWTSTAQSALSFVALDAGPSPLSGSVSNSSTAAGFDLTQCAATVAGFDTIHVRSAVRVDASAGTLISVTPQCRFYPGTACAGTPIAQGSTPMLIGQTASSFLRFDQVLPPVPRSAQSMSCTFTATRAAGGAFTLYLDDLFVGDDDIFKDGFE